MAKQPTDAIIKDGLAAMADEQELVDMYQRAMKRIAQACNCAAEESCDFCELARLMKNTLANAESEQGTVDNERD